MFNNKQRYAILSKAGYTGSTQEDEMEAFMQSKPSARSLVQKLERKAKEMRYTYLPVFIFTALQHALIYSANDWQWWQQLMNSVAGYN